MSTVAGHSDNFFTSTCPLLLRDVSEPERREQSGTSRSEVSDG